MKKFIQFFNPFKNKNTQAEIPDIPKGIQKTIRLSDEFEVKVTGLPSSLSKEEQEQIFTSLLKNGLNLSKNKPYQKGEDVFHGKAVLNLKDKAYQIEYSISTLKVLQALAVYKEAYDYVNQGAATGRFDQDLAEAAADYFRESAKQEVLGYSNQKRKIVTKVEAVDLKELPANQNPKQEERKDG